MTHISKKMNTVGIYQMYLNVFNSCCPNIFKLGHLQNKQHQCTSGMKKNAMTQGRETVA